MKKRGQFFLLAAVIISAVIISLGAGVNKVVVGNEPRDFYDFSYEVEREVGAVLDYQIYTDITGGPLDEFVDMLVIEVEERYPDADYLILYGTSDDYEIESRTSDEVDINGVVIPASEVESTVCFGDFCETVSGDVGDFLEHAAVPLEYFEDIVITMDGVSHDFSLDPEYEQVIFVMEQDVGGDKYVSVN